MPCPKCPALGQCPACSPDEIEAAPQLGEDEIVEILCEVLHPDNDDDGRASALEHIFDQTCSTRSFADACLLTHNKGLVLRVGDSEFQITVVRSR